MIAMFGDILLLITLTFLICVMIGVLRELEILRRKLEGIDQTGGSGLQEGAVIPPFNKVDVWTGDSLTDRALQGAPALFVFISAFCPTCREIPNALLDLADVTGIRTVLVCLGACQDCKFVSERLAGRIAVVCDEHSELVRIFQITTFPTSVVIDEGAKVRMVTRAVTSRDFRDLITRYANDSASVAAS